MPFYCRARILLSLLFFVCSVDVAAKNEQLIFSVNAPGTKPYLYFDEKTNAYQGIVVDFFATMQGDSAFDVVYLDTSRNRYEETLSRNKADLFLSAKDWLRDPQAFWFSDTIAPHNSHLYATRQFATDFDLQAISQSNICTRTNFIYPTLNDAFTHGKLTRLDSTNNATMTMMLLKNRCQYLVLGKEDAHAELFSAKYCNNVFYESTEVISSVNMVFVIRQNRTDLVNVLNTHLQAFIAKGLRDQSFIKHIGTAKFPKPRC
jgi:polar amino acid transport system substrate-binding protein